MYISYLMKQHETCVVSTTNRNSLIKLYSPCLSTKHHKFVLDLELERPTFMLY
jgi:hypothetical protein